MIPFKKILMALVFISIIFAQPAAAMAMPGVAQEHSRDTATRKLFNAIHRNQTKLVRQALAEGANPNAIEGGSTPLHQAILFDKPGMVALLLKHGADADLPNARGYRPLYVAIELTRDDFIIHLLLNYGANPGAPNINGITSILRAEEMYGQNSLLYHTLIRAQKEYERKRFQSGVKAIISPHPNDNGPA